MAAPNSSGYRPPSPDTGSDAHAGMPLAGDRKYGAGTNVTIGAGSLALCAASLTFLHPVTGKVMKFVTKPEGAEFKGISIPQM